jgi:hypothetical protein
MTSPDATGIRYGTSNKQPIPCVGWGCVLCYRCPGDPPYAGVMPRAGQEPRGFYVPSAFDYTIPGEKGKQRLPSFRKATLSETRGLPALAKVRFSEVQPGKGHKNTTNPASCIIRPMPTIDSDACRPLVPEHADQLFRCMASTFSWTPESACDPRELLPC